MLTTVTSEHSQTSDAPRPEPIVLIEVPRPLRPWSRYEDQIYANVPDDFEVRFVGGRTNLEGVHLIHASGSLDRLIGVNPGTRPKERLLKTRDFVKSLRRNHIKLVRTIHVPDSEFNDRYDEEASKLLDRSTALFIGVDARAVDKKSGPTIVIPYANLADRFDGYPRHDSETGRILAISPLGDDFVAQALARTIEFTRLAGLSVRIGGEASPAFNNLLTELGSTSLVTWRNENLSDGALIEEITSSEIVFPPDTNTLYGYHLMMMALSFDRPVAVPDLPITRSLRERYGSGRVVLYDAPLTAFKTDSLVTELRQDSGMGETGQSAENMAETSRRYFEAFRALVSNRNALNADNS